MNKPMAVDEIIPVSPASERPSWVVVSQVEEIIKEAEGESEPQSVEQAYWAYTVPMPGVRYYSNIWS